MNDEQDRSDRPGARKQAEEALRETRDYLEKLFRYANAPVIVWDPSFQIMRFNTAFERLTGYTAEEVIGKNLSLLFHPPPRTESLVQIEHARSGESWETVEIPIQCRDGTIRLVLWNSANIYAEDGVTLQATIAQGADITERKQLEQALQVSEEKYHSVFNNFIDLYYQTDMQGLITNLSPSCFILSGWKPEELIGHQVLELYPDPEQRKTLLEKLRREGAVSDYEITLLHRDGRHLSVSVSSHLIRDEQGNPKYVEGTIRDITERKRVKEALREARDYAESIINTVREPLIILDADLRVVSASRSFYRIFRVLPEETAGCLIYDLGNRQWDIPKLRELLETILPQKATFDNYEVEHDFTTIGRRIMLLNARQIQRGMGKERIILLAIEDITERKQLEERIRQVRSDLLFAVSHDLKTPLQVLNQSQEMLSALEPGEALARFQEYRQIWQRNLQRLERMINNLVDSQRGEEDRFPILLAPCRLEEIVQRVVEDLTGYALALQVQFNLKLEPVPEGSCDEEAIARVVENLLTNAVKFSPKGGRVEIRLGMEGDNLLLEVEDHGLGIPANEQAELFQPFQRGSAQHKGIPGTGLGLYVCRRIMEAHGGTIALESEEGKGTKVIVRLPWKKGVE